MEPPLHGGMLGRLLLRALQRGLEGPSPAARAPPGYLRAFAAEAAPQAVEEGAAAAAALAEPAAARLAQGGVLPSPAAALYSRQPQRSRLSPFAGLTEVLEQQRAALAARRAGGGGGGGGGMSPALQAMTWHQRQMDDTPAGRELRRNWQRQIILETKALEAARARYQKEALSAIKRGQAAAMPEARQMLLRWFGPLTAAILREQQRVVAGSRGIDRKVYGPYLLLLEPEQLAVLAMHCAINSVVAPEDSGGGAMAAPGQARVTRLALNIGKAVECQVNLERLQAEAHALNIQRQDVRELYLQGQELRKQLKQLQAADPGAELPEADWQQWLGLGAELREMGEVLPLDPHDWFWEHDFEERMRQLAAAAGVPKEGSTTVRRVEAAARRMLQGQEANWHHDIIAKVGVVLMKLLCDSCRIDVWRPGGASKSVPAFWHKLELGHDGSARGMWKRYGLLCAHEQVIARIKPHQMVEVFMPQYLPMLIPPVPWVRNNLGGHLTLRNTMMRIRGSRLQQEMLDAADREWVEGRGPGLSKVYEALDCLGSTAWSINQDVFRVVETVWAWGGGVCDIPLRSNLAVPRELPLGFRQHRRAPGQLLFYSASHSEVAARRFEVSRAKKKNRELHSLRCDMEYKLAIAREFAKERRFYFPHNVDFRGRAYPMHPHLNHLGADLARGLLQFAEGRPLGEHGLFWLYVQAANLWGQGVDKLPLWGRHRWVQDHLAQVVENARDPFRLAPYLSRQHGRRLSRAEQREVMRELMAGGGSRGQVAYWWQAENPLQFLATCVEIHKAHASGDPARYVSHLPVHQDGSCNGLQHYAALSRDLSGGHAVNLCPTDRPQDVYSEISALVRKRVAEDAAAGKAEAVALSEDTTVDRKLVKQTVMTSVYGVTFVGARAQVGNRLRERGFEDNQFMYKVSCYAAKVTLECLHEMFQSARDTMQWLSDCARLIAKEGHSVTWHTPLGLPVVQPYRRKDRQHVRTLLQRLVLVENNDELPVMKQRQRSAFPPNFIHSIDSSHMMLTAIACRQEGLDFAGVHDSFWTHAGTVERMNELLREKFIELHSQPLLEQLLEEFKQRYPGVEFPPLPPKGQLDLEQLREAAYFFS